jgi:hypothetical protein
MPVRATRPKNDVDYARGRFPERTYVSKTFPLPWAGSRDYGQPTRYVWKVFDDTSETDDLSTLPDLTRTEHELSANSRTQIRLEVTREAGNVRQIQIQKVPTDPNATQLQTVLTLDREAAARLMLVAETLDRIPIEGGEESLRVEDEVLQ